MVAMVVPPLAVNAWRTKDGVRGEGELTVKLKLYKVCKYDVVLVYSHLTYRIFQKEILPNLF